ncbi:MAG: HAD family phosphatase [Caulobacteraceae bacterium]|nr:HAD family phosphatase [Caulobacteraceae bacterium]
MAFPRPIAAVVFDMDGLLIDTETLWRDGMIAEAEAMGLVLPLETFKRLVGSPAAHTREVLLEHFGADFAVETYLDGAGRRFHEALDFETLLKDGVVELLDRLDVLGLPKAIATSSPHEAVRRHLGPMGVLPRFQAIIARGDYARGKPAPDPFLAAAAALGVEPEACLALEDSHVGVRAAHAAGMMTVMVPDVLEPTEEMHEKCVHVAESLHKVLALIG